MLTKEWVRENIERHKMGALDACMAAQWLETHGKPKQAATAWAREQVHVDCIEDLRQLAAEQEHEQ